MTRVIRLVLFVVGVTQLALAVAFFLQWPIAVGIWPFPGTTPLTFIFISSIFAAAAAPTLWVAATEHYGALAGIGLDYLTILAPVSVLSFRLGASTADPRMTTYAVACVIGAVFGLALFLWSVRFPLGRRVPMPGPVRWSFAVFIVALLYVGGRLVAGMPVIPWKVTPDVGVVMGWMFLGAAVYFAYALARPSWLNSVGQLIGFLAYDVVLVVPFVVRLPGVAPQQRFGLIVYTTVVLYSGLLAGYYLLVHGPTRLPWREPPGGHLAPPA